LALFEAADAKEALLECRVAFARALRSRGDTETALAQWEAALGTARPHLAVQSDSEPDVRFLMVG
jgi:hypothetical protein